MRPRQVLWVLLLSPLSLSSLAMERSGTDDSSQVGKPLSWTLLVYMSADNDLEQAALADIREMESSLPTSGVRVFVQLDRRSRGGSDRFEIQRKRPYKRTDQRPFFSEVAETLPEQDSADAKVLSDFLRWGAQQSVSDRLAVLVWGHGSGWQKTGWPTDRAIASDDSSGRMMKNADLKDALIHFADEEPHRSVDLLILDACLMNMSETLYALAGAAHYFIGSEETVPGDGLPYDDILGVLGSASDRDSVAVGKLMVKKYVESYSWGSQGNLGVQMSLVRLDRVGDLKDTIDEWVNEVLSLNDLDPAVLRESAKRAQTFQWASNRDLLDFVYRVREELSVQNKTSPTFLEATDELIKVYQEMILSNERHGRRYRNANGVAIFMPIDDTGNSFWNAGLGWEAFDYRETPFGQDSRWPHLLDYMYP